MKKILAMVLAFTMAISFAFSASASKYPDVDSGTEVGKAVDLLSGLNVIGGYPDGTFGQGKTITRAEVLKILFILSTGEGNEELYSGNNPMFPDVTGDKWYAPYVNWAVQLGIVGGYPDGTFKGDNPITFAEASKIFIVALGYKATDFAFPYGVIDRANRSGLYENVSGLTADDPAPRGIIALIGSNFLFVDDAPAYERWNANTKQYEYDEPIVKNFGAKSTDDVVLGTSNVNPGTITQTGKVNFQTAGVKDCTVDCDKMIGHAVTIWTSKDKKDGKDKIIAVTDEAEKVMNVTFSDFRTQADKDGNLAQYDIYVTVDGVKTPLFLAPRNATTNDSIKPTTQGFVATNIVYNNGAKDESFKAFQSKILPTMTNFYSEFTFIDNKVATDAADATAAAKAAKATPWVVGDPDWDYIGISYWLTGEVTAINAASISVTFEVGGVERTSTMTAEQVKGGIAGFAKGDYVNVAVTSGVIGTRIADIYTIEKSSVSTAVKVTSVSSTNKTITFGGKTYSLAANSLVSTGDFQLGKEVDIIFDKGGFVYESTAIKAVEDMMLIKDVVQNNGLLTGKASVTGILKDGTTKTFEVASSVTTLSIDGQVIYDSSKTGCWTNDAGNAATANDIAAIGKLVTYTIDGDGKITAMAIPSNGTAGGNNLYKFDKANMVLYKSTGGAYAIDKFVDNSTIVFKYDDKQTAEYTDDSFVVTTMASQTAFTDTKLAYVVTDKDDSSKATAIFITSDFGKAVGSTTQLAMRTGRYEINQVNDTTYNMDIELIMGGKVQSVTTTDVTVAKNSGESTVYAKIIAEIFDGVDFAARNATANAGFGYADIDGSGRLASYYEGTNANRDIDLSSIAASVTDNKDNATVIRGAFRKATGNIVTIAQTDTNGRATVEGQTVNDRKPYTYVREILLAAASDLKITIVDAKPGYANGDTMTATNGTLADLIGSTDIGTSGESYVIDFAVRHKDNNTANPLEIYQIIAYKQPVANYEIIA